MIQRIREHMASWAPGQKTGAFVLAFVAGMLCGLTAWVVAFCLAVLWIMRSFRLISWAAAVTALAAAVATANPPDVAAGLALADLRTLPEIKRLTTRYVSDISAERMIALNYALNAVSHSRVVTQAQPIGEGIARIDLNAYANYRDPESLKVLLAAWESLANIDPYWHITTQIIPPDKKEPETIVVDGGWITPKVSQELRALSGSAGCVLRADFFIAKVVAPPAYYQWAKVPATEDELLKSVGIDKDQQEKLAANTAANLLVSRITHKPRRVLHFSGPLGSTWVTQDVNSEAANKDPVRAPIDFKGKLGEAKFNFDASEVIFARPNHFWGGALYDSAGKIQQEVPANIAHDPGMKDGRVIPLVSCVHCHEVEGAGGLQSFKDDQFALLTGEAAILRSYLPEVASRVAELYDPARMNRAIERDRLDYADAVKLATLRTPAEASASLMRVYRGFVEEPVTRAAAAKECGLTEEQFIGATLASRDPILLSLRAGKSVRRGNFESSWNELMTLRGKP